MPPVGSFCANRVPNCVRYASTLVALQEGNCFFASAAARFPRFTSSCGENLFHPGLSCVLCPKALGIRRSDALRKNTAATPRMYLSEQMPRPALYLRLFHFDKRMPTSTSEQIRTEG